MPDPTDGVRRCSTCDAELPAGRSVCPSCGTLQRPPESAPAARPRTIGPIPVEPPSEPGVGEFPGLPPERGERRGPLALPPDRVAALRPSGSAPDPAPAATPASAPTAPAGPPAVEAEAWDDEGRRSPVLAVLAVVLAAVLVGAVALIALDRDDDPAPAVTADRIDAVRGFCDAPSALGDDLPPFDPTKAGIAYVQVPQPPSSTEPDDEVVVQVAPTLGDPVLTLEASAGLVNVALCLDEGVTSPAGGTCRFELTNPGDLGEEVERPLDRTTYEATLYELRTGEPLTSGPIATPTDRCPEFAFTDGDGVSTPLSPDELLAWLALQVPTGA